VELGSDCIQDVRLYHGFHSQAEAVAAAENTMSLAQAVLEQERKAAPPAAIQSQQRVAAEARRRKMALHWASRIIRKQMTLTAYRGMLSDQHKDGLNYLHGDRVEPTYKEVSLIIQEIHTQMGLMLDIRSATLPDTGEAGIMMPSSVLAYVLRDKELLSCCKFPIVPNAVAILTGVGDCPNLSEALKNLAIDHEDPADVLDMTKSFVNGPQVVLYFKEGPTVVDRVQELTDSEWKPEHWEVAPVLQLQLRCLIDAGARLGRWMGTTGQCLEIMSLKALEGFENNLVENNLLFDAQHHEHPRPPSRSSTRTVFGC
jgi:hypothetical protein